MQETIFYGNGIAELSVATGIAQALTFLVLLALSRASGVKTVALGWFWRGSLFVVVVGFALIDSFGPTVDALSAVMLSIGYPLLGFGVFLTTVETSLLRKCELAQAWTPVALAFGIGCFPAMVLGGVFESRVVCATGIVAVALTMLFLPVSGEDAANLPAVRLGSPDMSEYIGRRTQDLVARHALTAREGDVLGCLVSGLTYREIAGELGISEQTVKVHVRNLYAKCGVHSRGALMELLLSR